RVFHRAIELDPNNTTAHLKLGMEHVFIQGRSEEGLGEIRRALALDPLSFITHEYLAQALLATGRYQEAEDQARQATAIDPTQVTAYMSTGRALSLRGRHAEAVAVLQEANRRSAGHFPNIWLGCAYVTQTSAMRRSASCGRISNAIPEERLKTVAGWCTMHASATQTARSITWKRCMSRVSRFFLFGWPIRSWLGCART